MVSDFELLEAFLLVGIVVLLWWAAHDLREVKKGLSNERFR